MGQVGGTLAQDLTVTPLMTGSMILLGIVVGFLSMHLLFPSRRRPTSCGGRSSKVIMDEIAAVEVKLEGVAAEIDTLLCANAALGSVESRIAALINGLM